MATTPPEISIGSAVERTVVRDGELLRHCVAARLVHWGVALFFVPALATGFALFSPWLYGWLAPLCGGGARARLLHPWFGLAFVAAFAAMFARWLARMRWTADDSRWLGRLREFVTNSEAAEPDYVGKFNAGQKLWFWAIAASAVLFTASGVFLWWPEVFGRELMWVSYLVHDLAGLLMLGGFLVHLYEGTAQSPGTLRSMTRGSVTERWAATHHPAWLRELKAKNDE